MCEPGPPISCRPLLRMGHNWNECDTLFARHALHSAAKKAHPGHYWLHQRCIGVFMKEDPGVRVCMIFSLWSQSCFWLIWDSIWREKLPTRVARFKWMKSEWERRASEWERAGNARRQISTWCAAAGGIITYIAISLWMAVSTGIRGDRLKPRPLSAQWNAAHVLALGLKCFRRLLLFLAHWIFICSSPGWRSECILFVWALSTLWNEANHIKQRCWKEPSKRIVIAIWMKFQQECNNGNSVGRIFHLCLCLLHFYIGILCNILLACKILRGLTAKYSALRIHYKHSKFGNVWVSNLSDD